MSINWNLFKNNLSLYFDSNVNNTDTSDKLNEVASKIADEYEIAVKLGGDATFGNSIITYNKPGLQKNIAQAFRTGMNASDQTTTSQIFGNFFSLGLIQFWTGSQLGIIIPPPGTVGVVTNITTVPGIIIPVLQIVNTENKTEFIDAMIDFFKQHLQTISGITTALVPTPPGVPVPTPFPWVGYQ